MSRYAVDEERRALLVCWGTGGGDVARTVAVAAPGIMDARMLHLARMLSDLSAALWRTYTHPPSAAESVEVNTEGWRRQTERDLFARVPEALVNPNLPERGTIVQCYSPVEEGAHRVGRALHAIGDGHITERVAAEVDEEIAAVESAELGELSGRAHQAVMLSRADASPVQVAAAHQLLQDNPFGGTELFTEVDPAAAAIAAAHWLQAASGIASEASGIEATGVVVEADNIAALPYETPTAVLEAMADGATAYTVITCLIGDAMAAAEGAIPNLESLPGKIQQVQDTARRSGSSDSRLYAELLASIRTTPLDPLRPARDLLEDLLSGIEGCWLLFRDCAEDPDGTDDLGDFGNIDDDHIDDALHFGFCELLRNDAEATRDRLL